MIVIKRLYYDYKLSAFYSCPITDHRFIFRFLPLDTARQKVESREVFIANCHKYDEFPDSFGNETISGYINQQHARFDVTVSGSVITGIDIFEEYTNNPSEYAFYTCQTDITRPGERLLQLYDSLELDRAESAYEAALFLTGKLYEILSYDAVLTMTGDTAEQALSSGGGVCQDYAHIMLSLLRMRGITARYAAGMLMGEGASHAWVEVLCRGYWYGFDPTNRKLVNDEYIRVSGGRDASDCNVISGTMNWGAKQTQQERSVVIERRTVHKK